MLVLPENVPNDFESALPGSLGQIEIPGAAKKHGEVVVFTPEQRRAVDDALGGYLANYEAVWRADQIEDYYLFPGSKMRMLDSSGRRWTGKVRAGVKPLSRDGARVAFRGLEAIAKVEHVEGPATKSPGPVGTPATVTDWTFRTSKERAMGLEPTTSSLGRRRKNKP